MTQTTAPSTTTTTTTRPARAGLSSLYLVRAAFSVVWVTVILLSAHSIGSEDAPSAIVAVLLVLYPLWDAAATLLEQRTLGNDSGTRVRWANLGVGLIAAAAMLVAVFDTIGSTLLVFGLWTVLSGAIQLVVAVRRRHTVGAQWPMIISGGLSVLVGASFAAMSHSAGSLSGVAGYSAFGAFWFLIAAFGLRRRSGHDDH